MLKYRAISGALLVLAVLAVVLWLPVYGIPLVLVIIVTPALIEFRRLLDQASIPHFGAIFLTGGILWVGGSALWPLLAEPGSLSDFQVGLAWVLLVTVLLAALASPRTNPFHAAGATLLALAYVPVLFSFLSRLLFSWGVPDARLLVLYLILVVKISDICAYLVGSAWGRHKLFPRISPGKTWEGTLGGVAGAVLASFIFCRTRGGDLVAVEVPVIHALVLGAVLAIAGLAGDLIESMFKRTAGVKDSGAWIWGMGGVLDVLDSLLLAAPVLYVYIRLLLV